MPSDPDLLAAKKDRRAGKKHADNVLKYQSQNSCKLFLLILFDKIIVSF